MSAAAQTTVLDLFSRDALDPGWAQRCRSAEAETERAMPPRVRGECPPPDPDTEQRACAWVRCRYHLAIHVREDGALKIDSAG